MSLKGFGKSGGAADVIRDERKSDGGVRLPTARPEMRVHEILLTKLVRNSAQPRIHFDEAELRGLAADLETRGQLQPIVVKPLEDGEQYMVIVGERRWRAAELAGWEKIRAVWWTGESAGLDALVENVQRQNLLPLEVALHMVRLRDEENIPMRQLAAAANLREEEPSRLAKIATLPEDIREDYFRDDAAAGRQMAEGALYEIAMCSDRIRQGTMWHAAKEGASIAKLREMRKEREGEGPRQPTQRGPQNLLRSLGRAVKSTRKQLSELRSVSDGSLVLDDEGRKSLADLREEIDRLLKESG